MERRAVQPQSELTSLVISPNRELAQQFSATLPAARAFHILAEIKTYPPVATLDIRLRQLRPDLVFLDLTTDLDTATGLIEFIAGIRPPVYVVGLHSRNDSEAILRSLRAGATEFLYAPFDIEMQRQALGRIARLRKPAKQTENDRGRLVAFSSAKPGSGASTLACQTAFALSKLSGKRVLLADFDLCNGSVAFFFKISPFYSILDALRQIEEKGESDWSSLVSSTEGVDILAAPDLPAEAAVDEDKLHEVLESVRQVYDWIVIDLPSVFEKLSLLTISDSDEAFMVSTSELPSLHLTRKAVAYLGMLGFGLERFRVLVNRMGKQDGITGEDMAKIFGAPVHATFPNDYLSIHKGLTAGAPLAGKCPLGRSVESFVGQLTARAQADKKAGAQLN
jgi:Flp pilus assembly protein, ATPase CpaE